MKQFWVWCSLMSLTKAFYIPGIAPYAYLEGEQIHIRVNSVTSVQTHVPFGYYTHDFCKPDIIHDEAENLGELLMGENVETSVYHVRMMEPQHCRIICTTTPSQVDVNLFKKRIDDEYTINWVVDNLPAATRIEDTMLYEHGYFLGFEVDGDYYINNHVAITFQVHHQEGDLGYRIVGVIVDATSRDNINLETCESHQGQLLTSHTSNITWTYDVTFEESPVRWASRWDIYLSMNHRYSADIHWLSITNAILLVMILSVVVMAILIRTLRQDLSRYNRIATEITDMTEDLGWKVIHKDVCRGPDTFALMYAVMVGTASQLFCMVLVCMVLGMLGFVSPATRGSLMMCCLVFFLVLSYVAGYSAARTYKMFGGKHWQRCTVYVTTWFPGLVAGTFFLVNLGQWHAGSTAALPFYSMVVVFILWLCVSAPLTWVGCREGFLKETFAAVVKPSAIPRPIPPQPWYCHPVLVVLVSGGIPFSVVSLELYMIMDSIWLDQFYYVYGFLAMTFVLGCVACMEVTLVVLYFQLNREDHRWWWSSFCVSGSLGIWIWCYSIWYMIQHYDMISFLPALIYISYMTLMSLTAFLVFGVVGYYTSVWFIWSIYARLKLD